MVCWFLLPIDCVENSLQKNVFAGLSYYLLFALRTASKIWFAVFSYLSIVSRTASRRMSLLASPASFLPEEQPLKNVCCFLFPIGCVENSLQEDEFAGLSYLLFAVRTASKIWFAVFS
jgi:hypothetical protein